VNEPAMLQEAPDFSLVLGGPVFQLFRRAHLSGDTMELLKRRIIVITTIAWLPLLILSWLSGRALAGVALPFLHDIETQIRFLIALPMLISADFSSDCTPPVGQHVVGADRIARPRMSPPRRSRTKFLVVRQRTREW